MAELSSEHWKRVERCFSAAADMDAPDRRSYLDELAKSDPAVCIEVKSLLAVHSVAGSFLEDSALSQLTGLPPGSVRPRVSGAPGRHDPMIGRILGRYRIVRLIARGGMGSVYLAERADDEFEQRVAIKLIRPLGEMARAEDLLARFHNERQVLANLSHPNIAVLLDGGSTEDGLPYLVMEYVAGTRIDEYCDARGLTIEERITLFQTVCDAVQHAHQNLVIHRDLKPSNILVTEDRTVKLLDFGIARVLHEASSQRKRDETITAERRLTPAYASPEQLLGSTATPGVAITTSTDVYSLGVVLYELLTGRRPYELGGASEADVQRLICERPPTRPSTAVMLDNRQSAASQRPSANQRDRYAVADSSTLASLRGTDPARLQRILRGDLETILLTALSKEPQRRYASAQEFAADLGRVLRNEPIVARPPSAMYRARKFVQRNAVLTGMAAAIFVMLLLAMFGTTVGLVQARSALAEAERQTSIAQHVNMFLNEDLLMLASPAHNPDRDMTIRQALDAASARLEGGGVIGDADPSGLIEAAIRKTLAGAYFSLGEYEQSRHHWLARLELLEQALDSDDPAMLRTRSNLAFVKCVLGQCERAAELASEALERQLATLGESHRDTVRTMWRLARMRTLLGSYAEAEALYERALEVAEAALGPDHPETFAAMGHLGEIRLFKRQFDKAETLLSAALDGSLLALGEEHPDSLTAMNRLGVLLGKTGRYDEAESLLLRALETRRRVFGEAHDQTAVSFASLARVYVGRERHAEAEPLLVRALDACREVAGADSPQALAALHNLAVFYLELDRFDEALPFYEQAAETAQRIYPEDHMYVGVYLNSWAECLLYAGRAQEAEPIFHRVHAIFEERYGRSHRLTQRVAQNIERSRDER